MDAVEKALIKLGAFRTKDGKESWEYCVTNAIPLPVTQQTVQNIVTVVVKALAEKKNAKTKSA